MKKKKAKQDYESLFFKKAETKARSGKTVYIRKEFHDRIMRIIQVIGRNEITLFDYLDNVLEKHFADNKEDITALYQERNTDIF